MNSGVRWKKKHLWSCWCTSCLLLVVLYVDETAVRGNRKALRVLLLQRLLTSHEDGPNDAPSQDSTLVLQRHLEVVERHQKHEQVVHASQRIAVVDIIKQVPGTGRGERARTGLVFGEAGR